MTCSHKLLTIPRPLKPLILFVLIISSTYHVNIFAQDKPRILVLTDIENEPDDAQSLVRFLVYSNHWDVEGLVATTSTHLRDRIADWRIHEIVDAYGQVRDNLEQHESGFPEAEQLKALIKRGRPVYGMQGVGSGQDSEGSDWIIAMADRKDERPLWVLAWGGTNTLAQALWRVEHTRSRAELNKFISKLRVYTISDQDDTGIWMRNRYPDLFYIVSPGENYRHATWSGISGDPWYEFATGADSTLVQNPWIQVHIINDHGPLGAEYPLIEYAMEGDTPSFLGLIRNGLNVPGRPDYGGWGGRYELYQPRYLPYRMKTNNPPETRPIWTDAADEVRGRDGRIYIDNHATIWRWREHYQHDFAARMDWCTLSVDEANHPPIARLNHPATLPLQRGDTLWLDATNSTDPDGDDLTYEWVHYRETGDFFSYPWRGLKLAATGEGKAFMTLPVQATLDRPAITQIILCVTDTGTPSLTRYQRVHVDLRP